MKWKRPASSGGKKNSDSEPTKPFRRSAAGGGAERRDDRPEVADAPTSERRLAWPARDQMRKVTYYGGASERTRLYHPNAAERADDVATGDTNPVVGWVVIIEGPGKGRSLEIGIGANPIGRDAGQRISLDFGDNNIHREKHAVIIFDPKSGHFFLQAGNDSGNLTYLDDSLVRSATELRGGETLTLGRTKLRFVAFCGPDFSWF